MSDNHGKNTTPAFRAVILDFGEVLCLPPDPAVMRQIAKLFRIAPENFLEHYVASRGPYDQGLLTPEEYWTRFAEAAKVKLDRELIEQLRAMDLAMWNRMNVEMLKWVAQLHRAGIWTALLSNMQHDMAVHARKNFAWLAYFDHQILSCELQLIKPDVAIFERTIERIGARASETLFIDDRRANVDAAKLAGLRALQFTSVEQLKLDLMLMGFKVLPAIAEPAIIDTRSS